MVANSSYTLKQLLDLALCVPELGAVNFNILHTVIKTILEVQGLEDTRPHFHLDNPLIAQIAFCESKLKESKDSHKALEDPTATGEQNADSTTGEDINQLPSESGSASTHEPEPGSNNEVSAYVKSYFEINIGKRVEALEEGFNHLCCQTDQHGDKISDILVQTASDNTRIKKRFAEQSEHQEALKINVEELKKNILAQAADSKKDEEKKAIQAELNMLKERNEQLVYQVVDINDQVKDLLKSKSLEEDLFLLEKRVQDLEHEIDSINSRDDGFGAGMPFPPPMQQAGFGMDRPPPPTIMHRTKPKKIEEDEAEFDWLKSNLESFEKDKKAPKPEPSEEVKKEKPPKKKEKKKHKKHRHRETDESEPDKDDTDASDPAPKEEIKTFQLEEVKPIETQKSKDKSPEKKEDEKKAQVIKAEKLPESDKEATKEKVVELKLEKVAVGTVALEQEKSRTPQTVKPDTEARRSSVAIVTKEESDTKVTLKEIKKVPFKEEIEEAKVTKEEEVVVVSLPPKPADKKLDDSKLIDQKKTEDVKIPETAEAPEAPKIVQPKVSVTPQISFTRRLSTDEKEPPVVDSTSMLRLKTVIPKAEKVEVVDLSEEFKARDAKSVSDTAERASVKPIEAVADVSITTRATSIVTTQPETEEAAVEKVDAPGEDIAFVKVTTGERLRASSIAKVTQIEEGVISDVEDAHTSPTEDAKEPTLRQIGESPIEPSIPTLVEGEVEKDDERDIKPAEDAKKEPDTALKESAIEEKKSADLREEKVQEKEPEVKEDVETTVGDEVFKPKAPETEEELEEAKEVKTSIEDEFIEPEAAETEKELKAAPKEVEEISKKLDEVSKEVDEVSKKVDEISKGEEDIQRPQKIETMPGKELQVTEEKDQAAVAPQVLEEKDLAAVPSQVLEEKDQAAVTPQVLEKEVEVTKTQLEDSGEILGEEQVQDTAQPKVAEKIEVQVTDKEQEKASEVQQVQTEKKAEEKSEKKSAEEESKKEAEKQSEKEAEKKSEEEGENSESSSSEGKKSSSGSSSSGSSSSSSETSSGESESSSSIESLVGGEGGKTKAVLHTLGVLEEIEAKKKRQHDKGEIRGLIGTRHTAEARARAADAYALFEFDGSDDEESHHRKPHRAGKGYLTESVLDEHIKDLLTCFDSTMRNKSWEFDDKLKNIEETLIQTIQKIANDFENQIQIVNDKVMNRDKHLSRRTEEIEDLTKSIAMLKDLKADKHFVYQEICRKAEITEVDKKIDMSVFFSTFDVVIKNCTSMQSKLKEQEAKLQHSLDDIKTLLSKKLSCDDYKTLQEPVENRIKSIQHALKKLLHSQPVPEYDEVKMSKMSWNQQRSSKKLDSARSRVSDGKKSLSPTYQGAFIPLIIPKQTRSAIEAARALESVAVRGKTRYVGGVHSNVKSQVVKLPFIK